MQVMGVVGMEEDIGIDRAGHEVETSISAIEGIKLQLILQGFNVENLNTKIAQIINPLTDHLKFFTKNIGEQKSHTDERIEQFLKDFLKDVDSESGNYLPINDFICDKYGTARILSLPEHSDEFHAEYIDSYRTFNGILNNPSTDKRTTKDVFHIVESDMPTPLDKKEVPKVAFARMVRLAFQPDPENLILPFTSEQHNPIKLFTSNYIKPIVCPRIDGVQQAKRMEIRMFVPGSMVSMLDFTESIFGNGGSPMSPEHDIAMDPLGWTGHTGCIIFAPHLRKCTKKSLGLPHISHATDRQIRDGMYWEDENELYHSGKPFKIIARNGGGVIISIIADTYSGYAKKEVKTQMSYAANMMGMCEEEHSGGALVFPRYDLGDDFNYSEFFAVNHKFCDITKYLGDNIEIFDDGHGADKTYDDIIFVPEDATFSLPKLTVTWMKDQKEHSIPFELDKSYILPSGYTITLAKPDAKDGRWKMIGMVPDGSFCYKPATVSGGGKSEISKQIDQFLVAGPAIIHDFDNDFKAVKEILHKDISHHSKDPSIIDNRPILSPERSLGSVIKLLTPSDEHSDEFNEWLRTIPQHISDLLFAVKRFSRDFKEGEDWQKYFSVAEINGTYGNELYYNEEKLFEHYMRVGFDHVKNWRLFSLRDDFIPAFKFQLADDISSTTVVPTNNISYLKNSGRPNNSVKIVHNCEYRLFQRPDEAIVPGYDVETETDMAGNNLFTCNFRALTREDVEKMIQNRINFEKFSDPMKEMLIKFVESKHAPKYIVCPSELRISGNGNLCKNQRYLQNRHDICDIKGKHLTEISIRLWNKIHGEFELEDYPVDSILSGRRNNPAEPGIKPLCVYNPLHYMDLPELFLEYLTSVTGKSPSTTGAGVEGAMTKGAFNCVSFIYDLNAALLSFILTGYNGFLSAAGYVGPHYKFQHDITYLLPEIWCRMKRNERDPKFLIEHGFLQKCENFEYKGQIIPFERMGYRITQKFVCDFAGRAFSVPNVIFSDEMLQPELQDIDTFVESMLTIADAHRNAAKLIIDNNEIGAAIPPLRALLFIAKDGNYNGMTLSDPAFREMFKRENVIKSEWYTARLKNYQNYQIQHLSNGLQYITNLDQTLSNTDQIEQRKIAIQKELAMVQSQNYLNQLIGTLGR